VRLAVHAEVAAVGIEDAMELKNELLAFSKKLIGSTTPSSRAIGANA
jgi:hypothetical protein